jgi:hypothetical protein
MRPFRCAAAALLIAGLSVPGQAQTRDTLRPPARVSGYALRETTAIDPPGGTRYRYASANRHTIDVLIYPAAIADGEAAVRSEASSYRGWVKSGGYRQWFDRDSIASEAATTVRSGDTLSAPGHVFLLVLTRDSTQFISYFHLQSIHGWLVKVRATLPSQDFDDANAFDFSRQLTGLLLTRPTADR